MSANFLSEYSDRVRYYLSSRNFGTVQIDEPIGWDEDEKEFSRAKDYAGVFTNLSNSLKFIREAKEFISLVYQIDGINAEVILQKDSKHDQTDEWQSDYTGTLDFSSMEEENNQLSIKFNAGGLEAILKSREGESVEVDRTTTLDDKPLAELPIYKVNLPGRRIFLESTWKASPMNYFKELSVETAATTGATRYCSNTFPMEIIKKSHEQANFLSDGLNGNEYIGQTSMMLLIPVDRQRTFKVNINEISFNGYGSYASPVDSGYVAVSLVKYNYGGELSRINSEVIELWRRNFVSNHDIPSGLFTIPSGTYTITLNQGEALGLEVMLCADFRANWGAVGNTFRRKYFYKILSGRISIQEDSVFRPTICNAIKPFDLANRLVHILTNRKNAVKSSILESGKWKDLMITHGFWIRGFSKELDLTLPEENRKFKPLTTSFKDFITSLSAVCNIGVGIEKEGAREYVIIEDLKYFYNKNTTIRLPYQVSKVKRTVDHSNYFQSIDIGYEKGGEYEEAMGLDEFNIRNTYTTCIRKIDNKFTQISKYRADSYGIEFARRKPFNEYSTEDTSYDQDVFFIDCLPSQRNNVFRSVRLWNTDFPNMPTGIYSPETAYNLRLSPMNNLIRHGWVINAGLTKYPLQKMKYASSKGNSNLKTLYEESGEITNGELDQARYVPEIIEFDHICNSSIMKQLEKKVIVINEEVRACYGLVEFINENGDLEKGYILSVKPNGAGRWKLLKSNM